MLNTHIKHACRLSPAFLMIILLLTVFSCTGKRALVDVGAPRPFIADSAIAQALAMQPPSGVDPAVFNKLRDELVRQLTLRAEGKLASAAPSGAGAQVRDLAYDNDTGELTWSYANAGDYNIDGIVGVADITPLATYFGADTDDGIGNDPLETWLDGDGSGVIGIGDITPLAMGFGFEVASYIVMSGDSPTLISTQTGSTDFSARITNTIPPTFAYVNTGLPASGAYCKVIPRDSLSVAGIDSLPLNIATGGVIIDTDTIGPDGGTLDGGVVTVVFEAGSFADDIPLTLEDGPDDEYDEQVSDGFYIRGLPDSFTEPITVSIKLNTPPGEGDNFMLALDEGEVWASSAGGVSHGAVHFSGVTAEGVFTATIPPTTPDSGVSSLRSVSAETDKTVYITVVNRRHYLYSNSGKFLVYFPAGDEVLASTAADALDEAYTGLEGLGLSWARRTTWPFEITLAIRGPDDPDGVTYTSRFYGVNGANITLNSTRLTTDELARATAGHELMHAMQYLYDKRNRVASSLSDGGWLWLDEATAVWFERTMVASSAYVPGVVSSNLAWILEALETNTQGHGYGASMFIEYMAKKQGDTVVGDIVKRKWDSYAPIDALKAVTSSLIGVDWQLSSEDFMKLAVYGANSYPTSADINSLQQGAYQYVDETIDAGTVFTWVGAPHLSVKIFRVSFLTYANWKDTDELLVKFYGANPDEAPTDAAYIVAKYANSVYSYVGSFTDNEMMLEDVEPVADASGAYYFMIVNQSLSAPYSGSRADAINLQVGRQEDFMERLWKNDELEFRVSCDTAYSNSQGTSDTRGYYRSHFFNTIQWAGNDFWSGHESVNEGDDYYIDGVVDPINKTITLTFTYNYISSISSSWQNVSVTYTNVPLSPAESYVYPRIEGTFYGPICESYTTSFSDDGYWDYSPYNNSGAEDYSFSYTGPTFPDGPPSGDYIKIMFEHNWID